MKALWLIEWLLVLKTQQNVWFLTWLFSFILFAQGKRDAEVDLDIKKKQKKEKELVQAEKKAPPPKKVETSSSSPDSEDEVRV